MAMEVGQELIVLDHAVPVRVRLPDEILRVGALEVLAQDAPQVFRRDLST